MLVPQICAHAITHAASVRAQSYVEPMTTPHPNWLRQSSESGEASKRTLEGGLVPARPHPLAHERLTRENANVAVNDPQAKLDVVTPTTLLLRLPLALVLDGNRRIRSSAFLITAQVQQFWPPVSPASQIATNDCH